MATARWRVAERLRTVMPLLMIGLILEADDDAINEVRLTHSPNTKDPSS